MNISLKKMVIPKHFVYVDMHNISRKMIEIYFNE